MTGDQAIQLAIAIPIVAAFMWGLLTAFGWCYTMLGKIKIVVKQVTPNDGSSMNDRLVRLERETLRQTKQMWSHSAALIKIQRKLSIPVDDVQNKKEFDNEDEIDFSGDVS